MTNVFALCQVSEDLNAQFKGHLTAQTSKQSLSDVVSIKILNQGAWARSYERQPVSLPRELEDFIPEVEDFYKSKHSGRKLQWHHHMSNGTITFANDVGKFDLEVTTHQMAVLFCWENRRRVIFSRLPTYFVVCTNNTNTTSIFLLPYRIKINLLFD